MTRRPMTAAEKRADRFWQPLVGLTIIGAFILAGLIENGYMQ